MRSVHRADVTLASPENIATFEALPVIEKPDSAATIGKAICWPSSTGLPDIEKCRSEPKPESTGAPVTVGAPFELTSKRVGRVNASASQSEPGPGAGAASGSTESDHSAPAGITIPERNRNVPAASC